MMSDYEDYLKQQQAERGRVYNDMTLDERLAEFIEYCQQKTERYLVIDAHMEIFNLRDENTRLDDALAATAAELADATAQIQRLNEENRRLLAELEAARELGSITYQLQDELNAMSLELENKVTNDGWASIAVRNGLRVFVNVNTNEVSYKIATDKKRRSFNNYQGALNFLSEIKDGE